MNKKYKMLIGLILCISFVSCDDEWLDIKRNRKQVVPQKIEDLQALLDNSEIMNSNGPYLGENSSDDFYITADRWQTRGTTQRNAYVWAKDIYEGEMVHDWELSYQRIFYANTVLDGLIKLKQSEERSYVEGRALFYRAWNHYQLAQLFCKHYNSAMAASDRGIPLRTEANINVPVIRATVQQTYDRIIADGTRAAMMLPANPEVKTRPGKAAAHGLLARIYLQMGNYTKTLEHTEAALALQDELLDYNALDMSAGYPLQENVEVIYQSMIARASPVGSYSYVFCNDDLFASYEADDLRRQAFFMTADGVGFRGSYSMSTLNFFNGLATDELWLMNAECQARLEKKDVAMNMLNSLLEKRYTTGTFTPIVAADAEEALVTVLNERRKELAFRGIRWSDLRRLNTSPQFATTLTRDVDGTTYELPPNSPRYVLPIPDKVIELSRLVQNPR